MPNISARLPFKKSLLPVFALQLSPSESAPASSSFYKAFIDPRSELVKQSLEAFQPRHKVLSPAWQGITLLLPHFSNRNAAKKADLPIQFANTFGAAGDMIGITLGAAFSYGHTRSKFLSIGCAAVGGIVSGRLLGWAGQKFGGLFD